LTVLNLMETTDVTEDLWIMDINSSLITELSLKILILIKLEMDHVKLKLDLSKSLNSPMLDKEVLKP